MEREGSLPEVCSTGASVSHWTMARGRADCERAYFDELHGLLRWTMSRWHPATPPRLQDRPASQIISLRPSTDRSGHGKPSGAFPVLEPLPFEATRGACLARCGAISAIPHRVNFKFTIHPCNATSFCLCLCAPRRSNPSMTPGGVPIPARCRRTVPN